MPAAAKDFPGSAVISGAMGDRPAQRRISRQGRRMRRYALTGQLSRLGELTRLARHR
jgi:hypothetical protein